jgi:hypothetical protein
VLIVRGAGKCLGERGFVGRRGGRRLPVATQTPARPEGLDELEPNAGRVRVAPERLTTLGELAKFVALVALLAILADAAVGHAVMWENDPYWTYWITKTFLIATVFALGTAWIGVGAGRGAVITAVHTVILTVYYWSLAPVGLPSSPEWLDLEHTWVTGVPIHFGVIYLGYLVALWLWRRQRLVGRAEPRASLSAAATQALIVAVAIVVAIGGLEALALWEWQGATWYVTRLLIVIPFTLVWWAAAGRDRVSSVVGAVTLTAILASYSHFLGPIGLPDWPPRLFERGAPGATVEWLSYRAEFLVAVPITLMVVTLAFLAVSPDRGRVTTRRNVAIVAVVAFIVVLGAGVWAAFANETDDGHSFVTAAGASQVEQGPYYRGKFISARGSLHLDAKNENPRVTPLEPHDSVRLRATIEHPDGTTYVIRSNAPIVEDALGRFTTWWGVGNDVWHHGRSGIGSDRIPATFSEVAIFAVADISADGERIARGVPAHVMTMYDDMVELDVADPAIPQPSLPDGHLRVRWTNAEIEHSKSGEWSRYALGAAVLLSLLCGIAMLLRRPSAE